LRSEPKQVASKLFTPFKNHKVICFKKKRKNITSRSIHQINKNEMGLRI